LSQNSIINELDEGFLVILRNENAVFRNKESQRIEADTVREHIRPCSSPVGDELKTIKARQTSRLQLVADENFVGYQRVRMLKYRQ
jgi:hypothetical protein